MEKLDFTTFVLSVSSAAFVAMGEERDLGLAAQNIQLLELLAEKTEGNLTPEEGKLLEQSLFQTRLRFVELSSSTPGAGSAVQSK